MPASLSKGVSSRGRRGPYGGVGMTADTGRQHEQSCPCHHVLGKEVAHEPVAVCAAKKSDHSFCWWHFRPGNASGKGVPAPASLCVLGKRRCLLVSQTLVEAQIIKWTIVDCSMIYYCSFVQGVRVWFFRSAVYLPLCLKSLGTIMFIILKTGSLSFL